MSNTANHLQGSLSPYLQQHINNPVEWYPWCEEALTRAKQENKPICLSIGYSACHWCHVMAHESFEDDATAAIMNQNFINIKVDREERPDLDKIYQTAFQLLNHQSGGWPLNVFLTPDDHIPFFCCTYLPRVARHGLPAFKNVLIKIADLFSLNRTEIAIQNKELQNILNNMTQIKFSEEIQLNAEPIEFALDCIEEDFDQKNGGFGSAPKFSLPSNLQRLLRRRHDNPRDKVAIHMLEFTLTKMALGGIYDQLGGGFFRYSTDTRWIIPHFEKMLYDNALLLGLYARAYALSHNELYRSIAQETAEWIFRIMQAPNGGFYSTLDADSCGIEGKYYYWEKDEVKKLLTPDELILFNEVYGLSRPPNFEGKYHLYQSVPIYQLNDNQKTLLNSAKQKLTAARRLRIRPGLDDKIITAWNALVIRGMVIAGLILNEQSYLNTASKCLNFIKSHLWKNERLMACYKEGTAYQAAYLDDYAFLLDAVIFTLQSKWSNDFLEFAIKLADTLLEYFYDKDNGGFYFTARDHEVLIQRPKIFMDDALPNGNGIAAHALNRLGHLLAEPKYIDAAEATLKAGWEYMSEAPSSHNNMIHALEEFLQPPEIVILRGTDTVMKQWHQMLIEKKFNPHRLIFKVPSDDASMLPKHFMPSASSNQICAYVCRNFKCLEPIYNINDLLKIFSAT